jgi:hypothetical protein
LICKFVICSAAPGKAEYLNCVRAGNLLQGAPLKQQIHSLQHRNQQELKT